MADPVIEEAIDLIAEARQFLTDTDQDETEIRKEAERCNAFLALDQWDTDQLNARGNTRPSLTIDQIGQYHSQVDNDWKRNRVGVKVSPASGGTIQIADIIDGHIREIEYCSMAHRAYDNAFSQMTGSGRGFFKVTTRRIPGSFDQEILVREIPNAAQVYMDPHCQEPDYSDMRRCLIVTKMGLRQFKEKFPGATKSDFASLSQLSPNWVGADWAMVAEYWRAFETKRKIVLLSQPITISRENQLVQTDTPYADEISSLPQGVSVLQEDEDALLKIKQYLISGSERLDSTDWLGALIPVIPMIGKTVYYKDKKKVFSLISRSLDAQRVFNYAQSSMAERLGQFCRTPVVGAVGQFKTFADQWKTLNVQAYPYLEYDLVGPADRPLPPPARAEFDPQIGQMIEASNVSREYIRGTMGLHEANLGEAESRARSGVAVRELSRQGDNAIYNFQDAGGMAVALAGRIMVDLIPKIKQRSKTIRVRDNMGVSTELPTPQFTGKYAVVVTPARSNETQRKEFAEFGMDIYKELPPPMQLRAAPVILRTMDFHGAQELAQAIDPQPPTGPIDPGIKKIIDQQGQLIEQLTGEVKALLTEREQKTLELENKKAVAAINGVVQIRVAEIKAASSAGIAEADRDAEELESIYQRAHDVSMEAAKVATAPPETEPAEEPPNAME